MLKKILELNGVQELDSLTQKEIEGGGNVGGYLDGMHIGTEIFEPEPTPTPTWKYRCYSKNHQTGGTYYMSNVILRGYDCYLNN